MFHHGRTNSPESCKNMIVRPETTCDLVFENNVPVIYLIQKRLTFESTLLQKCNEIIFQFGSFFHPIVFFFAILKTWNENHLQKKRAHLKFFTPACELIMSEMPGTDFWNFSLPNNSKFTVEWNWNNKISQNIQSSRFVGKIYVFFFEKDLKFFQNSYRWQNCRKMRFKWYSILKMFYQPELWGFFGETAEKAQILQKKRWNVNGVWKTNPKLLKLKRLKRCFASGRRTSQKVAKTTW